MFLESSRSKFIGYTLGRWVPAEPAWGAADLRGVVAEATRVGAALGLCLAAEKS